MRLLILCYEFPPLGGGGSKVVDGLTGQLSNLGHEIHLVTTRFGDSPSFEKRGNLSIWRVDSLRRRSDRSNVLELASYVVAALFKARDLLQSNRYDVCHAHFIFPDGIVAWLLRRFMNQNFVVTAHGSDVPGYNPHRFVWAHRLLRPLWRRVSNAADCIVCPSEFLQDLLKRNDLACKTTVIPNGFDPARFSRPAPKKKAILCVTRLFERKGVQYLIEAVRDLNLPYELHIVGDGPYRAKLEKLAKSSRMPILFHGWVDNDSAEMERLFTSSEIFVLASEAENFPVSLLEAMSAGLAIVTCSSTGSADVVGDAALLVPCKDAVALRQSIVTLASDDILRARIGRQARKRLEDNFSWTSVTERHLRLYQNISARSPTPIAKNAGQYCSAAKVGEVRGPQCAFQQDGPLSQILPGAQSQPLLRPVDAHFKKPAE